MANDAGGIFVFDSTPGGLCVAGAIRRELPAERVELFLDLARSPYEHRTPAAVLSYFDQAIRAANSRPKHVLIACEATAAAVSMRAGIGQAAASTATDAFCRAAIDAAGDDPRPTIGILASPAAVERRSIERAVLKRRTRARLHLRPATTLANLAAEGRPKDDALLRLAIREAIEPLIDANCGVIALGWSILSAIRPAIDAAVNERAVVVDTASACAADLKRRLERMHLTNEPGDGGFDWTITDAPPALIARGDTWAGLDLPGPREIPIEQLESTRHATTTLKVS